MTSTPVGASRTLFAASCLSEEGCGKLVSGSKLAAMFETACLSFRSSELSEDFSDILFSDGDKLTAGASSRGDPAPDTSSRTLALLALEQ